MQAVINSTNKNYHGGIEKSFPLPEPNQRIIDIINEESLFDHCTIQEDPPMQDVEES
jgi:hypothetical protein